MATQPQPTDPAAALQHLRRELADLETWVSTAYDLLADNEIEPGPQEYGAILSILHIRLNTLRIRLH